MYLSSDVEDSRRSGYSPLQRAALVLKREGAVCTRLTEGSNRRQRTNSPQAHIEAVRDNDNTPLVRAQALLKLMESGQDKGLLMEMSSDVCTALALISNNVEIGCLAAENINEKEQDSIREIAIYAPWPKVREVAQRKLTNTKYIKDTFNAETEDNLRCLLKSKLKSKV